MKIKTNLKAGAAVGRAGAAIVVVPDISFVAQRITGPIDHLIAQSNIVLPTHMPPIA